ncbi:unnamed protein product [Chilo suppressalis]|uniref:Uncharacterized protein n=1 Tax=Chilo suppressalis TaxID=168631 RepID=A0ABN8B5X4_CHISP|nr:unnamed protein product [Chilo suppressalis]
MRQMLVFSTDQLRLLFYVKNHAILEYVIHNIIYCCFICASKNYQSHRGEIKFMKMKACFLCEKKNNVLDCDNASFKKCSLMLLFRRKKKYKYHDILLTLESTDDFEYHTECLKKITVISIYGYY